MQSLKYLLSGPLTDKVHLTLAFNNKVFLPPISLWVTGSTGQIFLLARVVDLGSWGLTWLDLWTGAPLLSSLPFLGHSSWLRLLPVDGGLRRSCILTCKHHHPPLTLYLPTPRCPEPIICPSPGSTGRTPHSEVKKQSCACWGPSNLAIFRGCSQGWWYPFDEDAIINDVSRQKTFSPVYVETNSKPEEAELCIHRPDQSRSRHPALDEEHFRGSLLSPLPLCCVLTLLTGHTQLGLGCLFSQCFYFTSLKSSYRGWVGRRGRQRMRWLDGLTDSADSR